MTSTEKAIASDTAKGRPSGTATMTTVIAIVKISIIFNKVAFSRSWLSENRILHTRKIVIVENTTNPAM